MTRKHTPLRPCGTCRTPVPDGNCPRHPKASHRYRPNRPSIVQGVYGKTWQAISRQVRASASGICAYCGEAAGSADHVIPHSRGGQPTLANAEAACRTCNERKADRTLTEWCASGQAPAAAHATLARRVAARLPS